MNNNIIYWWWVQSRSIDKKPTVQAVLTSHTWPVKRPE